MKKLLVFVLLVSLAVFSFAGGKAEKEAEKEEKKVLPAERKVREITFDITTPGYDPIRHDWCTMVAKNWEKLGIDVKLNPVETNVMITEGLKKHDYDAMILSWGGKPERIDPDFLLYTCLHSSQAKENLYNMDGYNNPEYDKLAEEQRRTMDQEERRKIVYKLQEIFAHDQPEIPVVHRNYMQAYNSEDFKNAVAMMGNGFNCRWNFVEIEPRGARKTLKIGHPEALFTLNPMRVVGLHVLAMFRLIYDNLMAISPEGKVVPWAAKEVNLVNDTTIDITLREGMSFHDGMPVTADDVKFTFDFIREWEVGPFIGSVEPVESVEITGDLSVRVTLKEPYAPFFGFTLSYVYIFPKHIWENVTEREGLDDPSEWSDWDALLVGSGPFKLDYWRRGEELKLDKHEGHFSDPKIDSILRIVYGDMQSLVMGLQKKDIDMINWNLSPIQAQQLEKLDYVTVVNVPNHGFYPIHLNNRVKPFDDVAFRRALAYAVPKKRIVEEFYEGYAVEANSMIGPMNEFWHNPDVEKFDLDLDKARSILEEAGYEWDSEGKLYYPPE